MNVNSPVVCGAELRKAVTITGVLCAVGALNLAVALAYGVVPQVLAGVGLSAWLTGTLVTVSVVAQVWALLHYLAHSDALFEFSSGAGIPVEESSRRLFASHLVALGTALLILAVASAVYITGLAWTWTKLPGRPSRDTIDPDSFTGMGPINPDLLVQDPQQRFLQYLFNTSEGIGFVGAVLLLAALLSIVGAIFFFSTSMWKKEDAVHVERFSEPKFWAGLWYRLGEAVLFGIVIFLVLVFFRPQDILIIPLFSLAVGMFLKAGERLISGIAARLFDTLGQIVPDRAQDAQALPALSTFRADGFEDAHGLTTHGKEAIAVLRDLEGVERVRYVEGAARLFVLRDAHASSLEAILLHARSCGVELTPDDA